MKLIVLHLLKALGLFYIARRFNANKTLILAYPGFEINDETEFRRQLYIKADTFKDRLEYLKKHCNIIPLEQLGQSNTATNQVVLTIDYGYYACLSVAAPILKQAQLPYTVYLSNENSQDVGQPIFHVALSYMLCKFVGQPFVYQHQSGLKIDELITRPKVDGIIDQITPLQSKENDMALLHDIAKTLNFDLTPIIDSKALTLLSVEQAKQLQDMGADIQLHSNPSPKAQQDLKVLEQERQASQAHVTAVKGKKPEHYCYPGGGYNSQGLEHLRQNGVKTATSSFAGYCDPNTNPLALPRFIDSEHIPQIVFEAEVCGVMSMLKGLLKR